MAGTLEMPDKMYSLYNKIEDFTFSMPEGWDDYTISIFIEACQKFKLDLRNYGGDFMKQWSRIVKYGLEKTSNKGCFNITFTMELAKVLKAYLLKNQNIYEYMNNNTFCSLLNDIKELLPFFPNANESQIPAFHVKKCNIPDQSKPLDVSNVIMTVCKQHGHLFGVKGIPTNILWSEMNQKVLEKTGLKVDVKQFLEPIKINIVKEVRKEKEAELKSKKFLSLANDYLAFFDYIPPRSIKKTEFLPEQLEKEDSANYKTSINPECSGDEYLDYEYMEVDDVGAYCEIPCSEEIDKISYSEESVPHANDFPTENMFDDASESITQNSLISEETLYHSDDMQTNDDEFEAIVNKYTSPIESNVCTILDDSSFVDECLMLQSEPAARVEYINRGITLVTNEKAGENFQSNCDGNISRDFKKIDENIVMGNDPIVNSCLVNEDNWCSSPSELAATETTLEQSQNEVIYSCDDNLFGPKAVIATDENRFSNFEADTTRYNIDNYTDKRIMEGRMLNEHSTEIISFKKTFRLDANCNDKCDAKHCSILDKTEIESSNNEGNNILASDISIFNFSECTTLECGCLRDIFGCRPCFTTQQTERNRENNIEECICHNIEECVANNVEECVSINSEKYACNDSTTGSDNIDTGEMITAAISKKNVPYSNIEECLNLENNNINEPDNIRADTHAGTNGNSPVTSSEESYTTLKDLVIARENVIDLTSDEDYSNLVTDDSSAPIITDDGDSDISDDESIVVDLTVDENDLDDDDSGNNNNAEMITDKVVSEDLTENLNVDITTVTDMDELEDNTAANMSINSDDDIIRNINGVGNNDNSDKSTVSITDILEGLVLNETRHTFCEDINNSFDEAVEEHNSFDDGPEMNEFSEITQEPEVEVPVEINKLSLPFTSANTKLPVVLSEKQRETMPDPLNEGVSKKSVDSSEIYEAVRLISSLSPKISKQICEAICHVDGRDYVQSIPSEEMIKSIINEQDSKEKHKETQTDMVPYSKEDNSFKTMNNIKTGLPSGQIYHKKRTDREISLNCQNKDQPKLETNINKVRSLGVSENQSCKSNNEKRIGYLTDVLAAVEQSESLSCQDENPIENNDLPPLEILNTAKKEVLTGIEPSVQCKNASENTEDSQLLLNIKRSTDGSGCDDANLSSKTNDLKQNTNVNVDTRLHTCNENEVNLIKKRSFNNGNISNSTNQLESPLGKKRKLEENENKSFHDRLRPRVLKYTDNCDRNMDEVLNGKRVVIYLDSNEVTKVLQQNKSKSLNIITNNENEQQVSKSGIKRSNSLTNDEVSKKLKMFNDTKLNCNKESMNSNKFEERSGDEDDDDDVEFRGFNNDISFNFSLSKLNLLKKHISKYKLNRKRYVVNSGPLTIDNHVVVLRKAVVVLRDFIQDVALSLDTDPKRHVCSCNCLRLMKEKVKMAEDPLSKMVKKNPDSKYVEPTNNVIQVGVNAAPQHNNEMTASTQSDKKKPQESIIVKADIHDNVDKENKKKGTYKFWREKRLAALGLTTDAVKVLQNYRRNELSTSIVLRELLHSEPQLEFGFDTEFEALTQFSCGSDQGSYNWHNKFITEYRNHQNWKVQLKWRMEKEILEVEKNKLKIIDKVFKLLIPKFNSD